MTHQHDPFRWNRAVLIILGNTLGIAILTALITTTVFSTMKPAPLRYLIWAQVVGFGISSPIFCGVAAHLAQRHPMRHVVAIITIRINLYCGARDWRVGWRLP